MMRRCDGTDPNLLVFDDEDERPCNCGRVFDDVKFTTVFPHQRILTQAEKAELMRQYRL